jgi:hypothetical protein
MTPLLTGYCFARCQPQAKVALCPAGQPAETPGGILCPGGVLGSPHSTPVDFDRPCTIPPGGYFYRGYCVTD